MDVSFFNDKEVIAYGTGGTGRFLIPHMANSSWVKLAGVTNSRVTELGMWRYFGTELPIKSVEEWAKEIPDATILITTDPIYHSKIVDRCRAAGFQSIVPLAGELKQFIFRDHFDRYIQGKGGITYDGNIFSSDEFKFVNPEQTVPGSEWVFILEISDLILPYCYNTRDVPLLEGPYEFSKVTLSQGNVVFDCGANMGIFSIFAAKRGCTAYAFEPLSDMHSIIEQNQRLNDVSVTTVGSAVSDHVGFASFYVNNSNVGGHTLLEQGTTIGSKEVSVPVTTIDRFVEENGLTRVDFIKADIEGSERLMLAGAQKTLAKFAPKLAICTYHLPDDKEVLTDLILKANPNYKIEYNWMKLYAYVPEKV